MKREKYRLTTEDFIKRAKEIHGDKYDYSKVKYVNKRTNVVIICPIHGEFSQNPHNHVQQHQGCPECGKEIAKKREGNYKNRRKTIDEFKKDLYKIYGDKYEVIGEYVNNKTKIKIFCHHRNTNGEEHGIFEAKPNDLLSGHGCKRCVHSKLEDDVELFLQENNLKYEHQKMFKEWLGTQRLDFFLPEYNIAIECQGRQHFLPVDFKGNGNEWAIEQFKKIQILDDKKNKLCTEHGIKILYFAENEYETKENLITDKEKLLKEIKNEKCKK